MVAKLISPQGQVFEISDETYLKISELLPEELRESVIQTEPTLEDIQQRINAQFEEFLAYRKQTHPHLSEQGQRQLAGMDLITANQEEGDDELWDEVDDFIQHNRFNLMDKSK